MLKLLKVLNMAKSLQRKVKVGFRLAMGEDVNRLSTKMWQDRITRRSITHIRMESGEYTLMETSQENKNPEIEWDFAWTSFTTKGLSPIQKSTLFQFSNNLCVNNQY